MSTEVLVPPLGQTVDTVTLVAWHKQEGETVVQGEPLFAIETDKATLDVEAPASGVLREVTAQPGDAVQVLHAIAVIGEPSEPLPQPPPPTITMDAFPEGRLRSGVGGFPEGRLRSAVRGKGSRPSPVLASRSTFRTGEGTASPPFLRGGLRGGVVGPALKIEGDFKIPTGCPPSKHRPAMNRRSARQRPMNGA